MCVCEGGRGGATERASQLRVRAVAGRGQAPWKRVGGVCVWGGASQMLVVGLRGRARRGQVGWAGLVGGEGGMIRRGEGGWEEGGGGEWGGGEWSIGGREGAGREGGTIRH